MIEAQVFWVEDDLAKSKLFSGSQALPGALDFANDRRRCGMRFVCISTENQNQVGDMGVASVENGKTPSGLDYTWKKRR